MGDEEKNNLEFTEINDLRMPNDFKSYSFSNFKKTQVCDEISKNIYRGKLENACYWSAELICAGHFYELWDEIVHYYSKYIHLANPKIAVYLEKRYQIFQNIINQGFFLNKLQLRNNIHIRNLFAEITCVLSQSPKKQCYEPVKIIRQEEYDINNLTERLCADSIDYIADVFQKNDPKELIVALNEFAYFLHPDHKNMNNACFWIEWIIDFTSLCKSKKQEFKCERRIYPVDIKYQKESIWIVWDILFVSCENMTHKLGYAYIEYIKKIMNAILILFCIKYTSGIAKKRRHLLYFAVSLLIEYVPTNVSIIENKLIIQNVLDGLNLVYKQIKKNEISTGTEYLYEMDGLESSKNKSFEQTIKKLEILNN